MEFNLDVTCFTFGVSSIIGWYCWRVHKLLNLAFTIKWLQNTLFVNYLTPSPISLTEIVPPGRCSTSPKAQVPQAACSQFGELSVCHPLGPEAHLSLEAPSPLHQVGGGGNVSLDTLLFSEVAFQDPGWVSAIFSPRNITLHPTKMDLKS